MGCYNDIQYKAIGCSCTYTECKSKHMLHTLALWGLVTITGRGGGLQKQNSKVGSQSFVSCAKCMHKLFKDRQQSSG